MSYTEKLQAALKNNNYTNGIKIVESIVSDYVNAAEKDDGDFEEAETSLLEALSRYQVRYWLSGRSVINDAAIDYQRVASKFYRPRVTGRTKLTSLCNLHERQKITAVHEALMAAHKAVQRAKYLQNKRQFATVNPRGDWGAGAVTVVAIR